MTATRSFLTNFPNGMSSDIGIRNVPAIVTNSGRQLWVDSNGPGSANTGKRGTFQRPYSTVSLALSSAQPFDTIWVKAGHVETVLAAGGWTFLAAVPGVRVVGIGFGNERPQITFSTSTAASVSVLAKGCALLNLIGIGGIASLANPINVQNSDFTCVLEWRDVAAKEALRAILTSAAAINCNIDLKHIGLSGSAVCLNAIRLVGSSNNRVNLDAFGTFNTGCVEFLTTAAVNTVITGQINNSLASTTHTKNVVDTVTGSHWSENYLDQATAATTMLVQANH